MTLSDLTIAQREILRLLPQRAPVERVDRLWIFPPQMGKTRETGLLVLSLTAAPDEDAERRTVLTVRYQAEQVKRKLRLTESVAEEGRASPDRIERVIAGVLRRAGEDAGEPIEVEVGPEEGQWAEWLAELDAAG